MKKFFSLFAAVLFAGSMMADAVTLDPSTQTPQTSETDINLTINGIGIAYHGTLNAASENNGTTYPADFRVFAGQTLKLSSATNKIEKVVIAGKAQKAGFTLSVDKGTITTGASYADVTEKGTLEDPLIVVENIGNNSVTLTCGKQIRAYKIQVTLGEAGQGGGGEEPPVVEADTLTCAQAAEQALAGKTDEVVIKGYVTEMVEEWSSHKNVSFWMSDTKGGANTFEAYRVKCETAAEAPTVGALVWVKGKLTKYTKNEVTIPETAAGGTFGILAKGEDVAPAQNLGEKTIAEFLSLKNKKDTCVLTGIVANIKTNEDGSYNKYGNFDLVELDNDEVSVYVYGLLTAAGENQKFQEMGIDEGDTLTCKAVYKEYNGKAEAENAIFVSVKKGEGGGEEEELFYDYEPEEATTLNITFKGISITDYTAEYGVVDIILTDNEEGDYEEALEWAYLEFVTSSYDDEAGLPAGTYQINDSEAEGTFTASPGGDDDYDYPCYLGVPADEEGYYNPYYIVSGTVTISAEGIEVNAKSYFGSTLKLVYNAPKDAVETTKIAGKAVKTLENGALYLDNNGVRYNVIGQTVR